MADDWITPGKTAAPTAGADDWITPEKATTSQKNLSSTKREHGIVDKLLGLGTERYQTWPERAVRDVIGLPKRAIDAAGSAPAGSRELTENLIAPAADTALAASPMSRAGRLTRAAPKVGAVEAPSQMELKAASDDAYKGLRQDTTKLRADVLDGLRDNIHDELTDNGFRDYAQPGVFRAIQELSRPVGQGVGADIEAVRQVLKNLPQNERGAARLALEKIGDYMKNIPHLAEKSKAATSNWAAYKKSQAITGAEQRGIDNANSSGLGGNLPNTLRQRLKAVLYDARTSKYLSQGEKDEIREILKRNKFDNFLEGLAKLGPKHPLMGWGGAMLTSAAKGKPLAAAQMGLGALGQKLAEWRMQEKIGKFDEKIRSNSELGRRSTATRKPGKTYGPGMNAATRGTALGDKAPQNETIPELMKRMGSE